jgi:hypothetical protein
MTPDDLDRIEQALGITLPASYRRAVDPFPVRACAGNAELAVWDAALPLIAYNLELRGGAPGGVTPWPSHFFALGQPGDGTPHALDLREEGVLWWVDRSHLDSPTSYRMTETFEAWVEQYFKDLREDLAGEGVDPDGTPEQRAAVEADLSRADTRFSLGCLAIALLLAGGAYAFRAWVRS